MLFCSYLFFSRMDNIKYWWYDIGKVMEKNDLKLENNDSNESNVIIIIVKQLTISLNEINESNNILYEEWILKSSVYRNLLMTNYY